MHFAGLQFGLHINAGSRPDCVDWVLIAKQQGHGPFPVSQFDME